MTFAVGALVRARGREWVVLPGSKEDLLLVRPLGGTDDESTGIYQPLEAVEAATFDLPDPTQLGDHRSCRLLRDAVRLGFRSSAGPFRSFAQLAVEPRPYQLVPLLMALRLDPVRLLIADDVGIGKTVEAGLVVREMLDRGEAARLAILCPPHLAEQWQKELAQKFHIDAELVLPATASRLERGCGLGQTIFEVYPHVIVSTEFIKADRRRDDFLRTCPELVVVDEAHTCAADAGQTGRHQRHDLLRGLARNSRRHLILVTATPHSGNEEAFRSLLALLNPDFADLPDDLVGKQNEHHRRQLAMHFVQRRRGDIRHFLKADTPFPAREDREESYKLSPEYRKLFERVLAYARESVQNPDGQRHRLRVRWWSALALLRSLASSPAAAIATLRSRAGVADTEDAAEADRIGRHTVLDLSDSDATEAIDVAPGGDAAEFARDAERGRRLLLDMAREAEHLLGDLDEKLKKAAGLVKDLLVQGHAPIIFCRFIPTAEYVALELRKRLGDVVEVAAVTGALAPAEREARVVRLGQAKQRVLVATDCLSEGINLQEHFDAVLHYDLSWNPTRHEQREGRVDRYGQSKERVCVVTYYGTNNQIDGLVLEVLLRKHRTIRSSLGVSVPVPADANQVVEAIFEGLLLREQSGHASEQLSLFEDFFRPKREELFRRWDAASSREKRSRTMFAQDTIKVDEVSRELAAVQAAIGSSGDAERFVSDALVAHGAVVSRSSRSMKIDVREASKALRDAMGCPDTFEARFELPINDGAIHLNRMHPWVAGVASYVLDSALDSVHDSAARRVGAIRTRRVDKRTTLILCRFRHHIITQSGKEERTLLAEEAQLLAFAGSPERAEWLGSEVAEGLLDAAPDANIHTEQACDFVRRVVDGAKHLQAHIDAAARQRAEELLDAHRRVRRSAHIRGMSQRVEPLLPSDILGIYVLLPVEVR